MRDFWLPMVRSIVGGVMTADNLDAIVYPTSPTRPSLVGDRGGSRAVPSATNLANLTGFPDLIVPVGYTSERLTVEISFFGPAFREARLLGLGYAFEQITKVHRDPAMTPALSGERIGR